jgi:hypothetical protein
MTRSPLMPECPVCRKPIPPGNGGLVRTRRRGRRVLYTVGRWCLFCEQWWIIETTVTAGSGSRDSGVGRQKNGDGENTERRVVGPRKACKREAAMAARAVFGRRHLAVPID